MSAWLKLRSPFAIFGYKSNCVMALNPKFNKLFIIYNDKQYLNLIFEYSFRNNSLKRHKISNELPKDFFVNDTGDIVAFDSETNKIYVGGKLHSQSAIAILEIKDDDDEMQWKFTMGSDMCNEWNGGNGIVIDGKFHIIGSCDAKHHIFDEETNQFEILPSGLFDAGDGGYFNHLFRIAKNRLLYFDGINFKQCNVINFNWTQLNNVTMPQKLTGFTATSVMNGNYVVIFAGPNHYQPHHDDCRLLHSNIWIYCVEDKKFVESKIKLCPFVSDWMKAITISDNKIDGKVVWGYIRKQWQLSAIDDHLFPPHYLIELIHSFYLQEWIHLLDYDATNLAPQHWKINLKYLFD